MDYQLRTYQDGYTIYELNEPSTRSWLRIAPERGGIVISHGIRGEEMLYLDKATFLDKTANIRGGIPVLFPISGQLSDGAYAWGNQTFRMNNHGFARQLPWEVVRTSTDKEASITLRLAADEGTMRQFPFDFELLFTYRLKEGALTIEQRYANRSSSEMPMYPGFHPYFLADRKTMAIDTDATRLYDYNTMREEPFSGTVDLDGQKESKMLLDPKRPEILFTAKTGSKLRMSYGGEFRYIVLWTQQGKPFMCVEPWMAPTGELHRGAGLVLLKPGETLKTYLTIDRA